MNRSLVRPLPVLLTALALSAVLSCPKRNHAADVPPVPAGRDSCLVDTVYAFTAIATDPDSDSVAVRIDWGDSTVSDWTTLTESGDTVALTHAWPAAGTYQVRAQARDAELLSSDWSDALEVRVYIYRPAPDAPSEPDGPAKGDTAVEYKFSTVAFHPESMPVAIRFAWGDGDTSGWSGLVAPGESVSANHTWAIPDTYVVTAQAKDSGDATSLWSAPHEIRIQPPDTLQLWRYKLTAMEGSFLYSSPAFGPDGNIYVGSPDSALHSLDPNGSTRWRYVTGGVVRSSPAIASDGTVYIGSYDNSLYAVNSDGSIRWTYATDDNIHASPAIGANGTIYVASLDHWLHAVSPEGSRIWRTLANKAARSAPAVAVDGVIYVGSQDDYIYAVSTDGNVKWGHKTGGTIHASPSFGADGTVYCGSDDGVLYALNPDSTVKWQFGAGGAVQSPVAIAPDGTIYFGADDSMLYALNPDGSLKWSYLTGGGIVGSPAVAVDGTVYLGSSDYCAYALNSDGSLKWQFETNGAIKSSPTIGPDGKVYITSSDGYLYALKGSSPLANSPWPKFHHDLRNTGRAQ